MRAHRRVRRPPSLRTSLFLCHSYTAMRPKQSPHPRWRWRWDVWLFCVVRTGGGGRQRQRRPPRWSPTPCSQPVQTNVSATALSALPSSPWSQPLPLSSHHTMRMAPIHTQLCANSLLPSRRVRMSPLRALHRRIEGGPSSIRMYLIHSPPRGGATTNKRLPLTHERLTHDHLSTPKTHLTMMTERRRPRRARQ